MITEEMLLTLKMTMELAVKPETQTSDIVQHVSSFVGYKTVVGFAERSSSDTYKVIHVTGENGSVLKGLEFSVGEGFLGHVVATRKTAQWTRVSHDPRARIFTQCDLRPGAVICCPVMHQDEIAGVLFALLPAPCDHAVTFLEFVSYVLGRQTLIESQERELEVRTARLAALIELSHVVQEVKEAKDILYMVLDMASNLVEGPFACIAFLPSLSKHAKIEIISRGISRTTAADYGKELLQSHFKRLKSDYKNQERPLLRFIGEHCVMEYPIFFGNVVRATLSIAVGAEGDSLEVIQLGHALAMIGSVALQYMYSHHEDDWMDSVELLHKASRFWSSDAYYRAVELQELVVAFTSWLNWTNTDTRYIGKAALLKEYDEVFLLETIPDLPDKIKDTIRDYQVIKNNHQTAPLSCMLEGQVLAVTAAHLSRQPLNLAGVERCLQKKFETFLVQHFTESQQLTSYENPAIFPLDETALSSLPICENLTARELQVLRLLIKGHTNKEIAQILFVSEHTIKNHMTNIFHKLGVADRAQAIALVLGNLR